MSSHKASSRKRTHPAEGHADVDIGFGSLFKGLGDFVGVLGKLVEAGEQQVERTGEFKVKGLGDKGHGVYGVSVRVGIGGEPVDRRLNRADVGGLGGNAIDEATGRESGAGVGAAGVNDASAPRHVGADRRPAGRLG